MLQLNVLISNWKRLSQENTNALTKSRLLLKPACESWTILIKSFTPVFLKGVRLGLWYCHISSIHKTQINERWIRNWNSFKQNSNVATEKIRLELKPGSIICTCIFHHSPGNFLYSQTFPDRNFEVVPFHSTLHSILIWTTPRLHWIMNL